MKKRTGMIILSIAGTLLGFGIAIWMAFGPDTVRLSRESIQTLIDAKLPFERDKVTVSNATVAFQENELVVNVDITGERLGQSFSLSAMTVGEPAYRDGSFYFIPSDVVLSNVAVGDASDKSVTDRIRDAAKRYLPDNEGARNLITDLAPAMEARLKEHTLKVAEAALAKIPVYTLKNDTKGIVAKAVLGKVYVENDELVITFTL